MEQISQMTETGPAAPEQKRAKAKALITAGVAGALVVGAMGTFAYFTGTDTVENVFTMSEGLADKIEVVEPGWDLTDEDANGVPDAAENLVPLQTVAKDPAVKNGSDIEAWCFVQVKVPTAEVSVVGEDGAPVAAASHELFTYEVNEGWTQSGDPVVADGYTTHTYLCDAQVAAGATSPALFDDVTLINLVEAQGNSGADKITVDGHAIQAEGFADAASAWAAYGAQNA